MKNCQKGFAQFTLFLIGFAIILVVWAVWSEQAHAPAKDSVGTAKDSQTTDNVSAGDTKPADIASNVPSVAKTEILTSSQTDLRGQAEKVQLADGTICGFINGATFGIDGERVSYGCGESKSPSKVIYGDLTEDDVWKANVAVVELDETKKEWVAKSKEVVEISKVWK